MEKHVSYNESTLENKKQGIEHAIDFLQRTGVFEMCADDEKKKQIIENLTTDEAVSFLERLNGIFIGMPIDDREALGNSGRLVSLVSGEAAYIPPEKPAIQKELIDRIILPTMKELDLDDAAVYAATNINLLHLFPDGNGRLARFITQHKTPTVRSWDAVAPCIIFPHTNSYEIQENKPLYLHL